MNRLLISTDSYLPRLDGVSIFLSEIVDELSDEYEITVLAPKYDGDAKQNNSIKTKLIPVYRFGLGEFKFPKIRLRVIKKQVRECDILFNQSIGTIGYFASRQAVKLKKPVVGFVHSIEHIRAPLYLSRLKRFAYWFLRKIEKKYFESCHLLLVPSDQTMDALKGLDIRTKKIKVSLGVDTDRFKPANDKISAKRKIGLNPHLKVIGYVGRLSREKNLKVLYEAFRRLDEKIPDLRLLIVGSGLKNEFFPDTKHIVFVNPTHNIEDYYQAMDVFVMPSFVETTSLVTMEAMSCGIPTLATKVGTIPNYLKPGINGYFFPKEHDKILSAKIQRLLEDKTLANNIGKEARKTIVTQFSWEKTVDQIKDALKELNL